MRSPCLRFHTSAAALNDQRRDYQFWRIRKPRAALGMVIGNACRRGRVIESSVVVFQFNDLRLRLGRSQRNSKHFTQLIG